MQYSCGYFTDWNNSLEQAQRDKIDMICRKLRLQPGEKMLDIGCGWGGLICHAAQKYGVKAHGVTLSQEQHDYTIEKVRRLGLEDLVTVELRDYNTLDGTYDKISSIGMYEHVGIANYPTYFRKIWSLLRDRGILLNHGITRRAKRQKGRFARMRPEHKLIAKYIFPGGELDHIGHTVESPRSDPLRSPRRRKLARTLRPNDPLLVPATVGSQRRSDRPRRPRTLPPMGRVPRQRELRLHRRFLENLPGRRQQAALEGPGGTAANAGGFIPGGVMRIVVLKKKGATGVPPVQVAFNRPILG